MIDNHKEPSTPNDKDTDKSAQDTNGQTVTIEILRHRQIFKILSDPAALWRFIGILMLAVFLIFLLLAFISLTLKRYYSYNDINTNIYGATTLKNEDKDVTYWLFNTAEMWANSGIRVHENDILTIRTSGSWHTAIHHLVEDSKSNSALRDNWIGADGGFKESPNDNFRSQFRISPDDIDGVLLMAVFPERFQNGRQIMNEGIENGYSKAFINALDAPVYDIYRIGRERVNVRMLSDGILHFAVNDIVLTRRNIKTMYAAYITSLSDNLLKPEEKRIVHKWIDSWSPDSQIVFTKEIRNIENRFEEIDGKIYRSSDADKNYPSNISFGKYPGQDSLMLLDNELIYYYNNQFFDAWFVDNIGSALVIIEHKHRDQI